jgi:uncharacterized protein YjbI with pentapeptide repeats
MLSETRAIVERRVGVPSRTGWWIPGALLFLAILASAGPAWACSCRFDPEGIFERASIVFLGTKIATERVTPSDCKEQFLPECHPHEVGVFSVEQILKGPHTAMVRVRSLDNLVCGPTYPLGETSWVAAVGDEERGYSYGSCMFFDLPTKANALLDTIDQYQDRRRSLNQAVERRPADPATLMALASFYAETHSRLEALAMVNRLLEVEPLHRDGVLLKADQLAIGPDQSAVLEALAPYLATHPDDKDALHQLVLSLVRLKRLGEVPSGWRDFTGLNGWDFDFSDGNLNNASFRNNRMYQTSFAKAELRQADFSEAEVMSGNFANADLTGAVMINAVLLWADFRGATLNGADLTGANLGGAKLEGAIYDDATVWPAGWPSAIKQQ